MRYSALHSLKCKGKRRLIHSADPQSRQVGIIVFAHVVRLYFRSSVRPHCSKSRKTKQSDNNVRYWGDCGSGRVDHWWHLSCYYYFGRSCYFFPLSLLSLKETAKFLFYAGPSFYLPLRGVTKGGEGGTCPWRQISGGKK